MFKKIFLRGREIKHLLLEGERGREGGREEGKEREREKGEKTRELSVYIKYYRGTKADTDE